MRHVELRVARGTLIMNSLRTLALILSGTTVAFGCGGGGGSVTSPTPGSTTPVTINIVGVNGKLSFSPNPAEVPPGRQAIFSNLDKVTHRVVLDDRSIDTGEIAPGASSQALALGGVSKPYHCSLHISMVGSLNQAPTREPPPCTGYCG